MAADSQQLPRQNTGLGEGFAITPDFQPRTRDEALTLAQAWGRTLSHWNNCAATSNGPDAIAACAQADAAEAQRLAALWTMLPDGIDELHRLRAQISWVRGMCSDGCSLEEIDVKLGEILRGDGV